MTDNVENLIIEHLRAIRAEVHSVKEDTEWLRTRMTVLETTVASLKRDQAL